MAAEAAVSFAVEKLGEALIQKVAFLRGVEGDVQWLKGELKRMQSFLKDASEKQAAATDESIRNWISDMRDVAQDAEDVIETFILKVDNPRRSRGLLERGACFASHVSHLDELGQEIKSIRGKLKAIDESRERYGIQNLDEGKEPRRPNALAQRRLSPDQKDKHLVGLEEKVDLLIREAILMDDKRGLSIATINGMGGSGKSTLAREVYNHPAVAEARFDCRSWVVVSEEFNLRETIKELMLQLLEPNEKKLDLLNIMEKTTEEDLKRMLRQRLEGRRYFIVLDDLWRQENWKSLASAFPDQQDKASRLLVTSRNSNVPESAQYVHEMEKLDPDQSWELLLKKALNDNTSGECPPELEQIGREIARKCGGLPLVITVVGGLLLKQVQSPVGWEEVRKGMISRLERSENSVLAILELSYHDLPPHLKSCFLCIGFFKEDAIIRAEKLIHLWVAEGLISQQRGDDQETMEEIATSYLHELINRNMVQVKDLKRNGRVKHCQVHDLIRELSITKAKEEISFEILREQENSSQSLNKKNRHRAIYFSNPESYFTSSSRSTITPNNKYLRTLFFHGGTRDRDRDRDRDGSNVSPSNYNWKSFGLLRVLDFEGLGLRKLPNSIGSLIGLRYLGLRNNDLKKLPRSLGRLKKLEVLDVTGNFGVNLSAFIWKMDSLRHLYGSFDWYKVPQKICSTSLKNIQTLMFVSTNNRMVEHVLIHMTCLRKLGIFIIEAIDASKLWTSLAKLENLASLKLYVSYFAMQLNLNGIASLHRLTQLKLGGNPDRYSWPASASDFPPNLCYLTMRSDLTEDLMAFLGKLPKLLYLKLGSHGILSSSEEIVISPYGFPTLKVLHLKHLYNRSIRIGKGGMPELKRLEILETYSCAGILESHSLLKELNSLTNLQELKIVTEHATTASRLRGEDFSNIPYVEIIYKM